MNLGAKRTARLTLGITAAICSRVFFSFLDDSEGPNLLVVVVMAAFIYLTALAIYTLNPLVRVPDKDMSLTSSVGRRAVLGLLATQILTTFVVYFCLI